MLVFSLLIALQVWLILCALHNIVSSISKLRLVNTNQFQPIRNTRYDFIITALVHVFLLSFRYTFIVLKKVMKFENSIPSIAAFPVSGNPWMATVPAKENISI